MKREFHVLLIENDVEEEKRLMQLMSEATPPGVRLWIHWERHLNRGLMMLIDSVYNIELIVIREDGEERDECKKLVKVMEVLGINTPLFERDEHDERLKRNIMIHAQARLRAAA